MEGDEIGLAAFIGEQSRKLGFGVLPAKHGGIVIRAYSNPEWFLKSRGLIESAPRNVAGSWYRAKGIGPMQTQDQIDCGADALRRYEQRGKMLRDWVNLPAATKRKWIAKAMIVLTAADREAKRAALVERQSSRLDP